MRWEYRAHENTHGSFPSQSWLWPSPRQFPLPRIPEPAGLKPSRPLTAMPAATQI